MTKRHLDHPATITSLERVGPIERDKPPLGDERDPIAEFLHVGHVVRGQDDRHPALAQFPNNPLELAGVDRVETGGRFVEKKQFGLMLNRPDEVETHLHPLGEFLDPTMSHLLQADHRQRLLRRATWFVVERGEEGQVFDRGELEVMVGQLEPHPDPLEVVAAP